MDKASVDRFLERERAAWIERPLTDEEAYEAEAIEAEVQIDLNAKPYWRKLRDDAVADIHDCFADQRGMQDFQALLEAVLKKEPDAALAALRKAIAIVAKARVRDRF